MMRCTLEWMFVFVKIILSTMCFIIFFVLMFDVWDKYQTKMTNTSIQQNSKNKSNKLLPPISICPYPAYKKKGIFYDQASYRNNTFSLEDVLVPSSIKHLQNGTHFTIKPIHSILLGCCYMITLLEPSKKFDFSFVLGFNTTWNHHVFIHPPGDEIWLSFTAFPFDTSYLRLDVNNRDGVSSSDLAITEKEIVLRDKESAPCKYYNDTGDIRAGYDNFISCSKKAIWANLSQEAICSIPGFDLFRDNGTSMRECLNETEGRDSIRKFQDIFLDFAGNSDSYDCPLPCERLSYSFTLNTLHNNSLLFEMPQNFTEKDVYVLMYYYKSLVVEKQVETLVYDFGGFLAAAGGNLGLCLGLSCLSIVFTLTQWMQLLLQWILQRAKRNI